MRLPKRLNEIIRKKEAFLDDVREKLERTALRLQTRLFEQIVEDIISEIEVKDGIILDNAHNYRVITSLTKVYETFNKQVVKEILPQINKGTQAITDFATEYFTLSFVDLPPKFERIIESTRVLTNLRIGLREEKMIRGGLLESILKIDKTSLQQSLSKSVAAQVDMKDFIKEIKKSVNGTEKQVGALQRQFQRFAYDTYQQYDRAYNKKLAEEFGMKYFVYQGSLVKDSRDFCVCHAGKVFSIEETELWATWKPSDCEYPEGYEIKAKNPNAVPSYLGFIGYDPLIDAGGYNCGHTLSYISDDLAKRLRPNLEI